MSGSGERDYLNIRIFTSWVKSVREYFIIHRPYMKIHDGNILISKERIEEHKENDNYQTDQNTGT